jgi:hypothetical protein
MLAKASIFTWSRRFLDTRALPSQKTCMGISSKVRSAQLPLEMSEALLEAEWLLSSSTTRLTN